MISNFFNMVLAVALVLASSAMVSFILINILLGCDNWDQEQWTPYKSCMAIGYIIGLD